MKRKLFSCLILMVVLPALLFAQGAVLRGTVRLQNSGNQPVGGFEVTASGAEAPVTTLPNGDFKLLFPKKSPGNRIFIKPNEEKYVWTNKTTYEKYNLPLDPDENEIVLEVCDRKEYERNLKAKQDAIDKDVKKKLEKLDHNDLSMDAKLDSVLQRMSGLNEDVKSSETYKKLLQEKEEIYAEKEKIEAERERLELMLMQKEENARKLASINVDNASELSQKAIDAINEGSIDEALEILNIDTLDRNLASIKANKLKLNKISADLDSIYDRAVQDYMTAAYIASSTYRFEEADVYYKKAVEADSTNTANAFIYALHKMIFSQSDENMLEVAELTIDPIERTYYTFFAGYFKLVKFALDGDSTKLTEGKTIMDKSFSEMERLYNKDPEGTELDYDRLILFKVLQLIAEGKYGEGRSLIAKNIGRLEKKYDSDKFEFGQIYSNFHSFLGLCGQFDPEYSNKKGIERSYLTAISIAKSIVTDSTLVDQSIYIIQQYVNLSLLYENTLKDTLKAEQALIDANDFLLSLYKKDTTLLTTLLADSYYNLGNFKYRFGKDGLSASKMAVKLYESLPADELEMVKPKLSDAYSTIGNHYLNLYNLDSCEAYIKKSIIFEESTYRINTQYAKMGIKAIPNVGISKNNNGEKTFEMSVGSDSKNKFQTNKKTLMGLYGQLGRIKYLQDSCTSGIQLLGKSISLYEDLDSITRTKSQYALASSHFYLANCHYNLGVVSPKILKNEFKKCLEIIQPFSDKDSLAFDELASMTLQGLGFLYANTRGVDSAELVYKAVHTLFAKKEGLRTNVESYNFFLNNFISFYKTREDYKSILPLLEEKELLYKKAATGYVLDSLVADNHYWKGLYSIFINDFEAGEKYLLSALKKMESLNKQDIRSKYWIAACNNNLGYTYNALGNFDLAQSYLEKALIQRQILTLHNKSINEDVLQTGNNLTTTYLKKAPKSPLFARKALKIANANKNLLNVTKVKEQNQSDYLQTIARVENETTPYIQAELAEMRPLLSAIQQLTNAVGDEYSIEANIESYEKAARLATDGLKKFPEHDSLYYAQGLAWGGLSWYYVLDKAYKKAEQAAKKALDLKQPIFEWVETNLALSYLLQNNWKACVEIYDRRSNEPYFNQDYKWKAVFIKDLEDLKSKSFQHPDIDKAIQYLGQKP